MAIGLGRSYSEVAISEWGSDVASALWGDAVVDAAEKSLDLNVEVDWRVSQRNIGSIRDEASDERQAGHAANAANWDGLASRMSQVLIAGRSALLREADPHNASVCLDFLDLLARLPGTERVGLPTYADTNYLDLAFAPAERPCDNGLCHETLPTQNARVERRLPAAGQLARWRDDGRFREPLGPRAAGAVSRR